MNLHRSPCPTKNRHHKSITIYPFPTRHITSRFHSPWFSFHITICTWGQTAVLFLVPVLFHNSSRQLAGWSPWSAPAHNPVDVLPLSTAPDSSSGCNPGHVHWKFPWVCMTGTWLDLSIFFTWSLCLHAYWERCFLCRSISISVSWQKSWSVY